MENNLIVIFDGVCNLCESSLVFIIKRDKSEKFKFVSAQSKTGIALQNRFSKCALGEETIILLKDERLYTRSDAVIEILKELDGAWKLLSIIKVLPKSLRDWIYQKVAHNRYRWFGRKDRCMRPSKGVSSRFLMDES